MQHKTLDEIGNHADVLPSWLRARPLSKCERLECWAEVLERQGRRRLKTLFQIEYARPAERAALHADDSPLSVAFKDPRLRAEGLAGDTWVTLSPSSARARRSCTTSYASATTGRRCRPKRQPRASGSPQRA